MMRLLRIHAHLTLDKLPILDVCMYMYLETRHQEKHNMVLNGSIVYFVMDHWLYIVNIALAKANIGQSVFFQISEIC